MGESPQAQSHSQAENAAVPGGKAQACFRSLFALYARQCFARPWAALALGVLFVVACCPGFALLTFNSADDVFYLRRSYGAAALVRMRDLFPFYPQDSATQVFFAAKDGRNLFSEEALLETGRAMDRLLGLRPDGEALPHFCERSWRGWCEAESVFHQFNASAAALGVTIAAQPGMGELEGLAHQLSQFCTQSTAACLAFLAPQERFTLVYTPGLEGSTGPHVASLSLTIFLDGRLEEADGSMSAVRYQQAVLDEVHAPSYTQGEDNLQTENFYVVTWSKAARDLEAARPALDEAHLMAATFVLITLFAWSAIAAPTSPRSRGLLAACCMLVVVLSLACATGLSAYVGVPFTSMTPLVVFTLFGVSVDDIIVITHAYDRLPGKPTLEGLEERLALSLQDSGPAISLTSATSLVAFLCAAAAPLPIITWFCVSAAFGILSVFALQLLIFVPMFVVDERRRLSRRRECGLSRCLGPVPQAEEEAGGAEDDAEGGRRMGSKCVQVLTAPSVGGGCGLVDRFARLVSSSHAIQGALATVFVISVGISFWGASQAATDADLSDYYVDTSFSKEHFDLQRTLWQSPSPLYFVIEHQGEGLFTDARWAEIDAVFGDLKDLDVTQEPYDNWLVDFDAYLNGTVAPGSLEAERARLTGDAGAFGAKVAEFLDAQPFEKPGGGLVAPWRHKRNVVLEGGVVRSSRLSVMFETDFSSPARYVSNFHQAMEVTFPDGFNAQLQRPRVPHTFGFAFLFPIAERDDIIKGIIFENLGVACGAVALTIMIMLSPLVGLFVGLLVVCLDAMILALLTLYGSKLDVVAFLCLSMNIGLVVDYSTHTAFTYMNHEGSPDEKLYTSMSKMGASVLSGGGSTLLGICVLAFASSKAFRTFFYVLGTAILMGTVVGITISPIFLRVFHSIGRTLLRSCGCRCRSDNAKALEEDRPPQAEAGPQAL